jgi:phosphoribosylaminoimidazole (AIR) synthetase
VIVAAATDALKTTRSGFVTGSLDRGGVWEIAGVSLHREVVSNFDGVGSVAEWVEQLRANGVDMVAIERSDAL